MNSLWATRVRHATVLLLTCTMTALLARQVVLAVGDPLIGTWQLNASKSTFNPGPPPKSLTIVYAAVGLALKATNRGVDAEGKPTTLEFTIAHDEQFYPSLGSRDYDSSAYKRVSDRTSEFTRKKAGKVVQTGTRVLSEDGRTLTFAVTGVNADGAKINHRVVFDRQ